MCEGPILTTSFVVRVGNHKPYPAVFQNPHQYATAPNGFHKVLAVGVGHEQPAPH